MKSDEMMILFLLNPREKLVCANKCHLYLASMFLYMVMFFMGSEGRGNNHKR